MSYHRGAYCGGIRTIEDIKERCRIDDVTGCWEWGMAYSDKGVPRAHIASSATGGKRLTTAAYRAAFILAGKRLGKGTVIFRECRNPKCCNPSHLKSMTQQEMGAKIAEMGYLKGNPRRMVINAKNTAKSRTPVEVCRRAEAMYSEGMLIKDIAVELGIHKQTASLICRGKHVNCAGRQNAIPGASVFVWSGSVAMNSERDAA